MRENMMEIHIKQPAGFFVACFAVMALMGSLAAVAIPNVGDMITKSKTEARAIELQKIQAGVSDMLNDSVCDELYAIGPTSDVGQVFTRDVPPLMLTDYLDGYVLETDCSYSFAADGTVLQVVP